MSPPEPEKNGNDAAPFHWTGQRQRAAALLAEDELTDVEIAAELRTTDRTLRLWKAHPEFAARVAELVRELGDLTRRRAIGRRAARLKALDDRWARMQRVIGERAADPQFENVAGGKTGLLVRTVKAVGRGEDFRLIDLFEVDTGLLRELREHERQAAQELDQWAERHEHSGKNGGPIEHEQTVFYIPSNHRDGDPPAAGAAGAVPVQPG